MNNGASAVSLIPEIVLTPGQRASEPLREEAYALWAWALAQDCERVADTLNARHPGLDVSGRVVRGWCQQDSWRVRYEEERSELTPAAARYAAARQLQNALPGAINYVEAVANGTVMPDRDRILACKIIIDSTGFAPISLARNVGPAEKPRTDADTLSLPDFAAMTPEERRAWELDRREQLRAPLRRQGAYAG